MYLATDLGFCELESCILNSLLQKLSYYPSILDLLTRYIIIFLFCKIIDESNIIFFYLIY